MIIAIYHRSWSRHWITISEVVKKNQKARFEMRLLGNSKFCTLIVNMIQQFGISQGSTSPYFSRPSSFKIDMRLLKLVKGIHKIARYSNFSIVPRNILDHKDIKEVEAILNPLIARADVNDFSRRVCKQ